MGYARMSGMKTLIIYHPNSEHSRAVEDYITDFKRSRGLEIGLVSLETREGADLAKLYDLVQYPALVVLRDDSQLIKFWSGLPLPLMDEVAGYANA